eukprot:Polyplicarium_translucidae@DN3199_c0_g1_i1.p1
MKEGVVVLLATLLGLNFGLAATECPTAQPCPTGAGECPFGLDVVFVQDLTHSYRDDLPNLRIQMPAFATAIEASHPDSRVGVVAFRDHPVERLGWPGFDYCGVISQALTDDETLLADAYNDMSAAGGYDFPEAQLQAVHFALRSPDVGWRPKGSRTSAGFPIYRVLVLVTDAPYHVAGDGDSVGLVPNDGDAILECGVEDYPTLSQVTEAFLERGAIFAVLSTDDPSVPAIDVSTLYEDLVNRTVGNNRGVVGELAPDAADFLVAIGDVIRGVEDLVCATCEESHAVELMYLQDLSASFSARLPSIKAEVGNALREVQAVYASSKFGLASFTDKPISPFGSAASMDYCYLLHFPMLTSIDSWEAVFSVAFTRGGGDWADDVLDALFSVATDPMVGFTRGLTGLNSDGLHVNRVIVVVTDGAAHKAGEGTPYGLVPHDDLPILDCANKDYPSVAQVGEKLRTIGGGQTAVAIGVPKLVAESYNLIAAEWSMMGLPTWIVPLEDMAVDIPNLIHAFGDPCHNVTGHSHVEV